MVEDKNNFDPWKERKDKTEDSGASFITFIKLGYWSISNAVLGVFGFIIFLTSIVLIFRHGNGLADLSFLELGWFFWIYFCLSRIKRTVSLLSKIGIKTIFKIFYTIGLIGFWVGVVMIILSLQNLIFSNASFLASNTVELGSLFVVFMGFGFVAFKKESYLEKSEAVL
tara:strand:- start:38 stop:544 length:507 start_codon:yes stop_codon:yes gene_type:complete